MTRLTFLLLSVMVLTSIVVLVPNVQATKHAYDAPCNVGDWEHRGQCCPSDTNHIAHSICLTEKEYQQRKQHTNEIVPCILGNVIKRNLIDSIIGNFNCIINKD